MSAISGIEILLVEDSAEDAQATMRALRDGNPQSRVHWVKDGEEALEFLFASGRYAGRNPARAPRLMLLDVKMPRIDGIEVLRRLKASNFKSVSVIVMASSVEERDVLQSYRLGASGYVVKPLGAEGFREALAKIGLT